MGKKLTLLFLSLIVLLGLSSSYIVVGLQAYARYQQDNRQHCGGQSPVRICVQSPPAIFSAFYPSYITTHTPLFTVTYSSSSPITLIVSVSILNFSQVDNSTVNAGPNLQSISFTPPLLNKSVLRQLISDASTSLRVRVTDTHNTLYYVNDSPLLLHSRWLMQWIATNRLKVAAWVTPGDPAVATLVARAITLLPDQPWPAPKAMVGYVGASPKAIRDQVDAIFDAMRLDYHIHYVQATVPYDGPGDDSGGLQDIHLPAEVLQQHSGMCIELTTLLASAVEHIGLNAEIVIIPGHAFLGVAVTPGNSQFEYWDAVEVNNNIVGDSANLYSDTEYAANAKKIVDTIMISDARKQGIGPML